MIYMIGFEEREIYCNVRNNYEVNEEEYTKIQKKYNELQILFLTFIYD